MFVVGEKMYTQNGKVTMRVHDLRASAISLRLRLNLLEVDNWKSVTCALESTENGRFQL